mmetsp:Transcript_48596/g.156962  ORF Transcript_48596/g.156962 Transcript_48596/m.156962 type:complete len:83 (+) Transcript_48596:829-1077(+)
MSGVRGRRIWDRRIAARGRAAEDGTGHPGASSRAGGDAQSASNEAARQQAAASSDESQGREARTSRDTATAGKDRSCPSHRC